MKLASKAIAGIVTVAAVLVLANCALSPKKAVLRDVTSTNDIPTEQGEIWGERHEQIAATIFEQSKEIVDRNREADPAAHRDAHPKAHGCVKAQWTTLNSELQAHEQLGVFAPASQPIKAWLRFSNGSPNGFNAADANSDVRGFALKIMTDKGSQDFVMINSPVFFSRDSDDYLELSTALNDGRVAMGFYLLRNPTNASILYKALAKIDSVLTTSFFGPVPIKLGHQSMRLKAQPCDGNFQNQPVVDHTHNNFLRESLVASLRQAPACFNILVQVNKDPNTNNIENPTLAWDEKVSPFVPAARVEILQQDDFDTPARNAFCDNLSFSPWHYSSQDLRPLGQINRIRRVVYDGISKYRHQLNGIPEIEPTDHDACGKATAALCKIP